MSVLFANGIATVILLLVAIVLFIATIGLLSDRDTAPGAIVTAVLVIIAIFGFSWSSTHRVVPANHTAILINRYTGQPSESTIKPGIVHKAWSEYLYIYPGQTAYQWCPEVTPSVKGGAEVAVKVCLTMDASIIDWRDQYLRYNGDESAILYGWLSSGVQSSIAVAISGYEPQQLTNNRSEVEKAIYDQLIGWMSSNNIVINSTSLLNWQFTSSEMKSAYEAAQVSVAKIDAARNEKEAAKIQAETASLRSSSCKNAGFTDQQYCLGFLQLQWLQNLGELPNNFVLSMGNQPSPSVAFPVQP